MNDIERLQAFIGWYGAPEDREAGEEELSDGGGAAGETEPVVSRGGGRPALTKPRGDGSMKRVGNLAVWAIRVAFFPDQVV